MEIESKMNNKDMLKIITWNCRGYRSKKNELGKIVQDYDIIVLIETKCQGSRNVYFLGFKTYYKESIGNSGGIAISVRNNLEFEIIQQWDNIGEEVDVIEVRIINVEEKFNLVAVYRRPGGVLPTRKWREIFLFDNRQFESIFVGDYNAHNTVWNCQNTDRNGERLWEVTIDNDIICLNQDTISRIGNVGQESSNIDLIFSTVEIMDKLEYEQIPDSWGSDHHPLEIRINESIIPYRKKTNRISTKKTR